MCKMMGQNCDRKVVCHVGEVAPPRGFVHRSCRMAQSEIEIWCVHEAIYVKQATLSAVFWPI